MRLKMNQSPKNFMDWKLPPQEKKLLCKFDPQPRFQTSLQSLYRAFYGGFWVSWRRNTKKSDGQKKNQPGDFWGVVLVVLTYIRWLKDVFTLQPKKWRISKLQESMNMNETVTWLMVSNIFIFIPKIGEMIQFDEHIIQMGWNHQLVLILTWLHRF